MPAKVLALEPPLTWSVASEKLPLNSEVTVAPAGVAASSLIAASVALPDATGASFTAVMVSESATVADEICVVPPVAPVRLMVALEDGDGEFVAAQIFPDVFDRVEFGSIGWQAHQSDVFGDRKRGSKMVAGAIEDESGVTACRHLAADRSEMQRHGLGVRRWHDQACCDATLRTGRAKQVGPVVALVVRRAGPRSTLMVSIVCIVAAPSL